MSDRSIAGQKSHSPGVVLADGGIGQALSKRGSRLDARVCDRDVQRWIVSAPAGWLQVMTTSPTVVLTAVAALGSAAVAGLFYAFSTFVMRGLGPTGPISAIIAMRGINSEAQANAPFLLLFFGSALLSVGVGVVGVTRWGQPGSWYLLAGAVFGVLAVVVTMAFNVPLNIRLDGIDPAALSRPEAASQWQAYFSAWTAWNHVRTATGFVAAALMLIGLRAL